MTDTSNQLSSLLHAYQIVAASLRVVVTAHSPFEGSSDTEAYQPMDEGALAACEGALISVANRIAEIADDTQRWEEDHAERGMRKQLMFAQVSWVNSQARIAAMMEQKLRDHNGDLSAFSAFKKSSIDPGTINGSKSPFNPPGNTDV